MTFNFRSLVVLGVLATVLMTAAACGGGSRSPTGNAAPSADTATGVNGASATTVSAAPPPTTTGSAGAMPTECQAYLNSVQACLDHVSAQNPTAVAQVRDILDVNRASIERLSHDGPPLEYCVSANNAWESRKSSFGC